MQGCAAKNEHIRGVAIGCKNCTFADSDEGGRRAAAICLLIQTDSSTTSIRRPGSPMC
jgi:hypothetical protein